jgi:hypothetical protein
MRTEEVAQNGFVGRQPTCVSAALKNALSGQMKGYRVRVVGMATIRDGKTVGHLVTELTNPVTGESVVLSWGNVYESLPKFMKAHGFTDPVVIGKSFGEALNFFVEAGKLDKLGPVF